MKRKVRKKESEEKKEVSCCSPLPFSSFPTSSLVTSPFHLLFFLFHSSHSSHISDRCVFFRVVDDTVKFDMASANVLLEGDVLMEFHHQIDYKRTKLLWSFYFHTAFIDVRPVGTREKKKFL